MKNLFDETAAAELERRLHDLTPGSKPVWGKMSAAQMLDHCSRMMEWAVGDRLPDKVFGLQLIGRMVKKSFVGNDDPMRRNMPTAKGLMVSGDRVLETEQARLYGLIDRFVRGGPALCTRNAHSFLGPLTPDEWAILLYKHLDHHLRQFGV